jgi:hypothetical protein
MPPAEGPRIRPVTWVAVGSGIGVLVGYTLLWYFRIRTGADDEIEAAYLGMTAIGGTLGAVFGPIVGAFRVVAGRRRAQRRPPRSVT